MTKHQHAVRICHIMAMSPSWRTEYEFVGTAGYLLASRARNSVPELQEDLDTFTPDSWEDRDMLDRMRWAIAASKLAEGWDP